MIRRVKAELYKNLLIMKRNHFRLFDITIWPIILFFAITLFLKYVSPSMQVMTMAITGLIGWRAVYHLQIESNIMYMEDYWSKNSSQLLVSPIRLREMLLSGVIAGSAKFLVVAAIYLTMAFFLFSFKIPDIFAFALAITYLCLCGFILGIITFALVLLYKDKAITFSFMIPDLFVLMSGVYYPISIFPSFMVSFVHILPTFYGFEILKSMVGLGTVNYPGMIIVGLLWSIFSLWFLSYAVKKAKKNGSLCNF